jgi:hypothetical protein
MSGGHTPSPSLVHFGTSPQSAPEPPAPPRPPLDVGGPGGESSSPAHAANSAAAEITSGGMVRRTERHEIA